MICMVILLNIGLAILFVHILSWGNCQWTSGNEWRGCHNLLENDHFRLIVFAAAGHKQAVPPAPQTGPEVKDEEASRRLPQLLQTFLLVWLWGSVKLLWSQGFNKRLKKIRYIWMRWCLCVQVGVGWWSTSSAELTQEKQRSRRLLSTLSVSTIKKLSSPPKLAHTGWLENH